MRDLWEQYQHLIAPLEPWLPWVFAASVGMSVLGLVMVPVVAIAIPADYFVRPIRAVPVTSEHRAWRWSVYVVRNTVATLLIGLGLVLILLPGNGLLLILVGLMVGDFPWKHRRMRQLVRRPGVHRPINWLRGKAGRPAIILTEPPAEAAGPVAPAVAAGS